MFQLWYDACVVRRRDGVVTAAELGDHHAAWAAANGKDPHDKTALGTRMRSRGHVSQKKGGKQKYFGIFLKPIIGGKPALAVVGGAAPRLVASA